MTSGNIDFDASPLEDAWNIYVFNFQSGSTWEERMKHLYKFDSVEKFWHAMHSMQKAKDIQNGTDVYMFKDGIKPMWEDSKNASGGRWILTIPPEADPHRYWEDVLMLCIGNDFPDDEDCRNICGVVYQPRSRGKKLCVWTSNWENEKSTLRIGARIKETLQHTDRLVFQTIDDQGRYANNKNEDLGSYYI